MRKKQVAWMAERLRHFGCQLIKFSPQVKIRPRVSEMALKKSHTFMEAPLEIFKPNAHWRRNQTSTSASLKSDSEPLTVGEVQKNNILDY